MPDSDVWTPPAGWVDPVADPGLPHVVAYDPAAPDPVPPAERIAAVERDDVETTAAAVGHFAAGGRS